MLESSHELQRVQDNQQRPAPLFYMAQGPCKILSDIYLPYKGNTIKYYFHMNFVVQGSQPTTSTTARSTTLLPQAPTTALLNTTVPSTTTTETWGDMHCTYQTHHTLFNSYSVKTCEWISSANAQIFKKELLLCLILFFVQKILNLQQLQQI